MKKLTLSFVLSVALAVTAAVGCSHGKKKLESSENRVVKGGIVSLSASTIKDRKNKFDVNFAIGNESGKSIIIVLDDLQCFKGADKGSLNHGMNGIASKMIDFHAGETKTFRFVCTMAGNKSGDPRVVVRKVYDNPNGDGMKLGDVLAENAEWTLASSAKPAAETAEPAKTEPAKAESTKSEDVKTMPAMEPEIEKN
ncbi:MAG: hypothetical protein HY074_06010 [Deltaproteobacteria bacterium]|nr:hypothetical protein [Deltaproteobacteria bacterium]